MFLCHVMRPFYGRCARCAELNKLSQIWNFIAQIHILRRKAACQTHRYRHLTSVCFERIAVSPWEACFDRKRDNVVSRCRTYFMVVLHQPHRQLPVQPLQRRAAHAGRAQRRAASLLTSKQPPHWSCWHQISELASNNLGERDGRASIPVFGRDHAHFLDTEAAKGSAPPPSRTSPID